MKNFKKILALVCSLAMVLSVMVGCGANKESVLIYTSSEDYKIESMNEALKAKFPNYDITIEYLSTGNHAAKLVSEGADTDCDIIHDLEYSYLTQLDSKGILADLSSYDKNIYTDDANLSENFIIELRNSGAIILNTKVLKDKGLAEPTGYEDLLKPEFKELISMPSPKASGTGYMFLKSLVNAWGEEKAFKYFDKLSPNVLQFTSSGSGPVNALIQGEVAVGLGMTSQAVNEINNGNKDLKIIFFEEGAPYTLYGQSIVKGKEENPVVKEVFDYLINEYNYINNEKFFPEKIYKDKDYALENYPQNISYADMKNNTIEEKDNLLAKWKY